MRCFLLLTIFLSTGIMSADAQQYGFQKDDVMISGVVGGSKIKYDTKNESAYQFSVMGGFSLSDHFSLGIFSTISHDFDAASSSEVGMYGRYYFKPAKQFSVYGDLNLGYGIKKIAGDRNNYSFMSISPGINYFLTNHIAITSTFGEIGFRREKLDKLGSSKEDYLSLGLDLNTINLGIILKY